MLIFLQRRRFPIKWDKMKTTDSSTSVMVRFNCQKHLVGEFSAVGNTDFKQTKKTTHAYTFCLQYHSHLTLRLFGVQSAQPYVGTVTWMKTNTKIKRSVVSDAANWEHEVRLEKEP